MVFFSTEFGRATFFFILLLFGCSFLCWYSAPPPPTQDDNNPTSIDDAAAAASSPSQLSQEELRQTINNSLIISKVVRRVSLKVADGGLLERISQVWLSTSGRRIQESTLDEESSVTQVDKKSMQKDDDKEGHIPNDNTPHFDYSTDHSNHVNNNVIHKSDNTISHGTTCDICLLDYELDDQVANSPNDGCVHVFHKECITSWLLRNPNCPCCRRDYLCIEAKEGNNPEV